jgi:hypothetical protein
MDRPQAEPPADHVSRIASLRREYRRWRLGALAALILAVVAVAVAARPRAERVPANPPGPKVAADRFVLRDDKGQVGASHSVGERGVAETRGQGDRSVL